MARSRLRISGALVGLALVAATADFVRFANRTAALAPMETASDTPIIVLTGGSGLRIAEGMRLLRENPDRRLLVSGVHPDITAEELARQTDSEIQLFACCVDIGYAATSTIENAVEVRDWVDANGYREVILVTSNYHIPRALIELQRQSPDVSFLLYPVTTKTDPERWHSHPKSFRGMIEEWAKYRVTTIRRAGQV